MRSEAEQIEYFTEEDYYALPDDRRAELIDGILYDMASPSISHQAISSEIFIEITSHIRKNGGKCRVFYAPCDVKLFPEEDGNIVQPDLLVVCDPDKIHPNRLEGAPDLIVEIVSPGNPAHDYVRKLDLYDRAGVREYWIVDPMRKKTMVYALEKDSFSMNDYGFDETVPSQIFQGMSIDFKAISERI